MANRCRFRRGGAKIIALLLCYSALGIRHSAFADTHYVSLTGGNVPPYTNWAMAATNIQDALDACVAADNVLVGDGTFRLGGRVGPVSQGVTTSRVVVASGVRLESLNGPQLTCIEGAGPQGSNAVRCAYLESGASICGFTLRGGSVPLSSMGDRAGGGLRCETGASASNCILVGNSALTGGGAYRGTLYNCMIVANWAAQQGGGCYECTLVNCTVSSNSAPLGGGAAHSGLDSCLVTGNSASQGGGGVYYGSADQTTIYGNRALDDTRTSAFAGGALYVGLRNSIITGNQSVSDPNYRGGDLSFCCTETQASGPGNISADPQFVSLGHIAISSPCVAGGTPPVDGHDADGQNWLTPPSIGVDEVSLTAMTGSLSVSVSTIATTVATRVAVSLGADVRGSCESNIWDFGDGTLQTNKIQTSHAWFTSGTFTCRVAAFNRDRRDGVATGVVMIVVDREASASYVATNSVSPAYPFGCWSNAAHDIQSAIDAQILFGGLVIVSNGVYDRGGRSTPGGALSNRLVITNHVFIRSVNGPQVTAVVGRGPVGPLAVRCAYLADGGLEGFTLTNGHTLKTGGVIDQSGGGAFVYAGSLSNCVITGNRCYNGGGGVWNGELDNCILCFNAATQFNGSGGASAWSVLRNCQLVSNMAVTGGGCYQGRLERCAVEGNLAKNAGGGSYIASAVRSVFTGNVASNGGGAAFSALMNCVLHHNMASGVGGGVLGGSLSNCTLALNAADGSAGGASQALAKNSIIFDNAAASNPNFTGTGFSFCCTWPMPSNALANITNSPGLADLAATNFDLCAASPCINAGSYDPWMSTADDALGGPRIQLGGVDLGAHEFRFEPQLVARLPGAFDPTSGLMHVSGIATSSPYASAPNSLTSGISNAVDWVEVSVRSTPTSPPAASVAAILLADGRIVMPDAGTNVLLEAAGNQHLVLRHRNHLAVMTAVAVLTNRYGSFDFSTNVWGVLGTTNSMVPLGGGKWGLIPGDADGDGVIHDADEAVRRTQEAP